MKIAGMRYEWHRELAIYHKLTVTLRELEESGWEIFSISYDANGYYHVICRKEQQ